MPSIPTFTPAGPSSSLYEDRFRTHLAMARSPPGSLDFDVLSVGSTISSLSSTPGSFVDIAFEDVPLELPEPTVDLNSTDSIQRTGDENIERFWHEIEVAQHLFNAAQRRKWDEKLQEIQALHKAEIEARDSEICKLRAELDKKCHADGTHDQESMYTCDSRSGTTPQIERVLTDLFQFELLDHVHSSPSHDQSESAKFLLSCNDCVDLLCLLRVEDPKRKPFGKEIFKILSAGFPRAYVFQKHAPHDDDIIDLDCNACHHLLAHVAARSYNFEDAQKLLRGLRKDEKKTRDQNFDLLRHVNDNEGKLHKAEHDVTRYRNLVFEDQRKAKAAINENGKLTALLASARNSNRLLEHKAKTDAILIATNAYAIHKANDENINLQRQLQQADQKALHLDISAEMWRRFALGKDRHIEFLHASHEQSECCESSNESVSSFALPDRLLDISDRVLTSASLTVHLQRVNSEHLLTIDALRNENRELLKKDHEIEEIREKLQDVIIQRIDEQTAATEYREGMEYEMNHLRSNLDDTERDVRDANGRNEELTEDNEELATTNSALTSENASLKARLAEAERRLALPTVRDV